MYFVNVEDSVNIAVYDINPTAKKTLLFVHGWPLDHRMFEYQLNVLPGYGFRCITIDLRGFGNSDAPWNGYSYDRIADDLFEVIKSISAPSMALIGFSMGGAAVIRYMARYREYKISKLALLSAAAPSFVKRENYPYGMTMDVVNELILNLYKDRPQTITDFGKNFFAQPHSESFLNWFNLITLKQPGYSTIKAVMTLRDADLRQDLLQIHVPTGIFHGVLDKVCPFEFSLEMESGIPNSKLFKFDQSGHGIFYDELETFNHRFLEFLNS